MLKEFERDDNAVLGVGYHVRRIDASGLSYFDDLFMVRNNFGTSLATVPEPATLSLLGIGALLLLRRRTR